MGLTGLSDEANRILAEEIPDWCKRTFRNARLLEPHIVGYFLLEQLVQQREKIEALENHVRTLERRHF